MKKIREVLVLTAALLVIFGYIDGPMVKAQAAIPAFPAYIVSTNTGTLSQCPAVAAGQAGWCIASGVYYVEQNGGAWTPLPTGTAAAPQLTINNITKTLPASFTVGTTAPTATAPTVSAPAITVN